MLATGSGLYLNNQDTHCRRAIPLTRKPGEALLIEPEDAATTETLAAELLAHRGLTVWIKEIRGNSVRLLRAARGWDQISLANAANLDPRFCSAA